MDVRTLINELRALPPEDRQRVFAAFREEQVPDLTDVFTPEQIQELDRRLDLDDAGSSEGESWDVVKTRIKAGR
jgi:hypothetical protein